MEHDRSVAHGGQDRDVREIIDLLRTLVETHLQLAKSLNTSLKLMLEFPTFPISRKKHYNTMCKKIPPIIQKLQEIQASLNGSSSSSSPVYSTKNMLYDISEELNDIADYCNRQKVHNA
jgi:hypothetical protein